jgi:hypothetical protein
MEKWFEDGRKLKNFMVENGLYAAEMDKFLQT